MKYLQFGFATILLCVLFPTVGLYGEDSVFDVTEYNEGSSAKTDRDKLVTVQIRGKINHASNPETQSYHAVVPGVHVWLAEFPQSKSLNVTSDDAGWWTMSLTKVQGTDLNISLIYAKEGWITTKSNVLVVTDEGKPDVAIQYIDPNYFRSFIKPGIEIMIKAVTGDLEATFKNAVVVTVGKSWASIHDDRLPHGDPGATVNEIPGAIKPLYFDKSVRPNPSLTSTSVDGGVVWLNVPKGEHRVNATKEGVTYEEATFVVDDEDAQHGVMLYIASPPDSVQGSNDSGPGED